MDMKRISFAALLSFGYKTEYPQRLLIIGYLAYSIIGGLLPMLPFCSREGISVIDNVFTPFNHRIVNDICVVGIYILILVHHLREREVA